MHQLQIEHLNYIILKQLLTEIPWGRTLLLGFLKANFLYSYSLFKHHYASSIASKMDSKPKFEAIEA